MFGGDDHESRGIIPRATSYLFAALSDDSEVEEVNIKCSFLEIYKEHLLDLLQRADANGDDSKAPSLKIRQTKEKGTYVQGIVEKYVYNPADVLDLIREGEGYRTVAHTNMNEVSSRSHSVFNVTVTQTMKDGVVKQGKLSLVDLAGSENVQKSGATGLTLLEAQKINKSLSALGNVIFALTERRDHIPYRDSKLTHLLQDSLGGNTKTVLIVTASPHWTAYTETLSTLKFAKRAKEIKNKPHINQFESADNLKHVVDYLEKELASSEARVKDMSLMLEMMGVTQDEDGQFKVPEKEPGQPAAPSGPVDAKEVNQLKAREVRLLRRLERYERKVEKINKSRKKEQAYYAHLKDLFTKQRELAQWLSEEMKKRDETIELLTKEVDEYNEFQRSVEEAAQKEPARLPDIIKEKRVRREEADARPSPAKIDTNNLQDEFVCDSPPDSPTGSDAGSTISTTSYASRAAALQRQEDIIRRSPSNEHVRAYMQRREEEKLGYDTVSSVGSLASTASNFSRMSLSPDEAKELAATRVAINIVEGGGVFMKYPYGSGLMAKKSRKQIFYEKTMGLLYYWDVNKMIKTSSKSMPVMDITDIYVGKRTPAFQKGIAKDAIDDCCLSIRDKDRSLDLEAASKEQRDAWVCAVHHLVMSIWKRSGNGRPKPTLHGDLPYDFTNPPRTFKPDEKSQSQSSGNIDGDSSGSDKDEDDDDNDNDEPGEAKIPEEGPFKVRAQYDFAAKSDLQLSFKKGDILTVLTKKKEGWWDAQKGSEIGSIPYNYVKPI